MDWILLLDPTCSRSAPWQASQLSDLLPWQNGTPGSILGLKSRLDLKGLFWVFPWGIGTGQPTPITILGLLPHSQRPSGCPWKPGWSPQPAERKRMYMNRSKAEAGRHTRWWLGWGSINIVFAESFPHKICHPPGAYSGCLGHNGHHLNWLSDFAILPRSPALARRKVRDPCQSYTSHRPQVQSNPPVPKNACKLLSKTARKDSIIIKQNYRTRKLTYWIYGSPSSRAEQYQENRRH